MTSRFPPKLNVTGVSFSHGHSSILNGIDLRLDHGEKLAVVGPNGSGKSTLLRCLYAWHRPASGAVLLDGKDIHEVAPAARARDIAVLAQEPASGLELTVEEIVELGRLPHGRGWKSRSAQDAEIVEWAIHIVGLIAYRDRVFNSLSGGEKQRVLFARALAQRPSLLILDEPTNHLDIRYQLELLEIASGLDIGIVATLHDINLAARWADRICLLHDGAICAIGTPDAVLEPALVGEVYGVDVGRDLDPRTGTPRLHFYTRAEK